MTCTSDAAAIQIDLESGKLLVTVHDKDDFRTRTTNAHVADASGVFFFTSRFEINAVLASFFVSFFGSPMSLRFPLLLIIVANEEFLHQQVHCHPHSIEHPIGTEHALR